MALGITQVRVVQPPRVGLVSSGDEIIPPDQQLTLGRVRDVNSYSLSALVREAGGQARRFGIAPDDTRVLLELAKQALDQSDILVITAGSSASTRDITAQVINALGPPGVLVHGISIKPGKPTILGLCGDKAVLGLPGNPMSAFVIAWLFLTPLIEKFLGLKVTRPRHSVKAKLTVNLPSQSGREDWIGVQLEKTNEGYAARPIFGRSNFIFSLIRADGLICIPDDVTGLSNGEIVEVLV